MSIPPDPRATPDEDPADAVINEGVSATQPAEGADDEPAQRPGSPKG